WIRLMRASGEEKNTEAAYGAFVVALERLSPPDFARAVDEQLNLLTYLEARPKTPAAEQAVALAKVNLGRLEGLAGDWKAAEQTLPAAREDLLRLRAPLDAARASYELARHFELNRSDFKSAVALYERAITEFEEQKAFDKKPPEEAMRAVRGAGAIYL